MEERIIVMATDLGERNFDIKSSMQELKELVFAAGGEVVGEMTQNLDKVNARIYMGEGKALELKELLEELEADAVVFNEELSGTQLRNLEEVLECKVIDRTNLILDIFAQRATTLEGKLQVKLAQMKYRLPRIIGYSTHLSKLGGGIGTRGPGESQLETDRRHVLKEINNVEKQLAKSKENRTVTRQKRNLSHIPLVALMGYTNAGKSTIMNAILNLNPVHDEVKEVFVKDMLFATLDTSHRQAKLNQGQSILISDTVGFVSKLPTALVNAFEGTLDELRYADLIIHVVDASNPNLALQMETTNLILKNMEIETPILTVFNKSDKIDVERIDAIHEDFTEKMFISALDPVEVSHLVNRIEVLLKDKFKMMNFSIPFDDLSILDYFSKKYDIMNLEYNEIGATFRAGVSLEDAGRYAQYEVKSND